MTCQKCKGAFQIDENDRSFYGRLGVGEPTFCPDCRHRRRLFFRNERALYKRKCDVTGNFFPPSLSPFGYNETLAKEYYPMTRDEALARGYRWQELSTGTFGKETIAEKDLPESIEKTPDTILSDILVCKDCGKNYRITQAEFDFYKRMGLPIPHSDFECRHQARMAKRNPRALTHRSCMCEVDNHGHERKCSNEFETSYSPERKEQVFCESCYQKEVS